ncbi:DVU_1553 family AMP-dependent CoA ligase [Desulfolucanica intricata]|uniref:DVU_1553 family AMP-dependent CoA ligase n=1 Tax=Desulfolucanica intricata TaxID=1285191 RepID=UPI00082C14DA|nr:AMP-binding protein [Desulfolucanica intricata]
MRITPLEDWIKHKISGGRLAEGRLTRNEIESYQLDKIREVVSRARKHSAFYRQHLAGLTEANLNSLDDFAGFPFTTARDLQQSTGRFLCVSQSEINRVVTLQTSGTGGTPKRIFFTREDQELTIDFLKHGMSTLVGAGDRVLILLPGQLPGSVGDLLLTALQRLGVVGIPHGLVQDARKTLEVICTQEVTALVGIPTQVLALARCSEPGNRSEPVKIKNVLLSTDHVPAAIVRELNNTWGCRVFNHYGMTEMGLGGGVECQALDGYHLREADLYFEIVDPAGGLPVPDGEPGEVVFTTLTRRGMPLIRYRTGDVAYFIPEPCPCGTVLKRMARVKERLAGRIHLGGEIYLSMADLDEALFPLEGLLDFRAALQPGNILQVQIKTARWAGPDIVTSARRAIEDIKVIRKARTEAKLVVAPVVLWKDNTRSGAGKRMIADMRQPVG